MGTSWDVQDDSPPPVPPGLLCPMPPACVPPAHVGATSLLGGILALCTPPLHPALPETTGTFSCQQPSREPEPAACCPPSNACAPMFDSTQTCRAHIHVCTRTHKQPSAPKAPACGIEATTNLGLSCGRH